MIKLTKIIDLLEKKYPKRNAEEWDNIGLLIGRRDKEVKRVQISLDVTLEAIAAAKKNNVDLIISHHPIIFKTLKKITSDDVLGKKIIELIKSDISVYSLHTNLDSTRNGLNDYLLKKIGVEKSEIFDKIENEDYGIGRVFKLEEEVLISDYIDYIAEKLEIKDIAFIGKNKEKKIKKIAIINGSAMSCWKKAKSKAVDLFITGDVTYHDALDAKEADLSVLDIGHFESEHFFYDIIEKDLKEFKLEITIFNDGPVIDRIKR